MLAKFLIFVSLLSHLTFYNDIDTYEPIYYSKVLSIALVSVASIAYLFYKRKFYNIFSTPPIFLLISSYIFALLINFNSIGIKGLEFIFWLFSANILMNYYSKFSDNTKVFYDLFFSTNIFILLVYIFTFIFPEYAVAQNNSIGHKVINSNLLGVLSALSLLFTFYKILANNYSFGYLLLNLLVSFFLIYIVIQSGSRTAILAIFIGFFMYISFLYRPFIYSIFPLFILSFYSLMHFDDVDYSTLIFRYEIWKTVISSYFSDGHFFGYGILNLSSDGYLMIDGQYVKNGQNGFINSLAYGGVFLFLSLLLFYLSVFYRILIINHLFYNKYMAGFLTSSFTFFLLYELSEGLLVGYPSSLLPVMFIFYLSLIRIDHA